MKKALLTGLVLSVLATPVLAEDNAKAFGTVENIAVSSNTFTVKGDDGNMYLFNVNEATDIEKNGSWVDEDLTITDMKTGDRVQVEYFATNPDFLVVDEVEIFPAQK